MPTATVANTAECRVCGAMIEKQDDSILECPSCEGLQEFMPRRRPDGNRPGRETLTEVRSEHFNGVYKIYKNQDGTLSCSCPSFMKGNSDAAGAQRYACKHIRNAIGSDEPATNGSSPSAWQTAALKKLGVSRPERLTNDQAYFLINDILAYQGVTYREYERILREHGKISVLPILPVGAEFEGYVPSSVGYNGLNDKFSDAGLPSVVPGYTHNQMIDPASGRAMYKLVTDSSLYNMRGFNGVEIVTPKLFGATGFGEIRKALSAWRSTGGCVNHNCGCHVHVDAYNYDRASLLELMKVWAKIERPVLWYLVSPSRRDGQWSHALCAQHIRHAAVDGIGSIMRYLSLNVSSFLHYKTVEFRLHQGTTSSQKIVSWTIFLMKLVEAVGNGLTHNDVEPTPDGVFDAIGMDETSTSRIRRAREYLAQRYVLWKDDADENPSHIPQVDDIDLGAVEREIETIIADRRTRSRSGRGAAMTLTRDEADTVRRWIGSPSTISELSRTRAAVHFTPEVPDPDAERYLVSAVRGNRTTRYAVQRRGGERVSGNDTLMCPCRGFQRRFACSHTVNLARVLTRVIEARRSTSTILPVNPQPAHDSSNVAVAAGR